MITISEVRFIGAGREEVAGGLLGWARCVLDDAIRVDGIAVRRTRDGCLTLSFPVREDRHGRRHHILRPISDRARREIENAIFRALPVEATRRR